MQTITLEQQAAFAAFGQVLDQPQQLPVTIDLSQLAIAVPLPPPVQVVAAAAPILFSAKHDAAKGWLHPQFPSTFKGTKGGQRYFSAEQYYCEKKAVLAKDKEAQAKILAVTCIPVVNGVFDWSVVDAAHARLHQLVREIKNLNPQDWVNHAVQIMRQALTYKFCQDETLFKLLLETGNAYLIYAIPQDGFWGIGCTEEAAITGQVPSSHWGQNLLGNLLMELRNKLRVEGRPEWGYVMQPIPEVSLNRNRPLEQELPVASVVPSVIPQVEAVAIAPEPAVVAVDEVIAVSEEAKIDESPLAPVQEQIAAIEAIQDVPDVYSIAVDEVVAEPELKVEAPNPLLELFGK